MNTFVFFVIGYAVFLALMIFYLRRLDRKQEEIKTLLDQMNKP